MELKDFVKGVIFDITNAVKECQQELDNGAIICPTNSGAKEQVLSRKDGALTVSNVDFEVSVSVGSSNEFAGKITVLSALVGGGSTNRDENVTKVRFSIPVVLPFVHVRKDSSVTNTRYSG